MGREDLTKLGGLELVAPIDQRQTISYLSSFAPQIPTSFVHGFSVLQRRRLVQRRVQLFVLSSCYFWLPHALGTETSTSTQSGNASWV